MQTLEEIKIPPKNQVAVSVGFFDMQGFDLIQRVSKAFACSDLVPATYQGKVANCMIALDMAQRMNANPLMVMQNLYIVYGNPSWSSKFLIATVNSCGKYSAMRYEWRGEEGEDNYGCRAWAMEKDTGERLDGIWVDWKMVKKEGWHEKKMSKWMTMPDQMFIYRSAAFWVRAYAPELSMGLQTQEEAIDVYDATADENGMFAVDLSSLKEVVNEPEPEKTVDHPKGEEPAPATTTVKKERKPRTSKAKKEEEAAVVVETDPIKEQVVEGEVTKVKPRTRSKRSME